MKIKTREEILNQIIKDGKKHPKDWRAVIGKDEKRLSNDYYIFNPNIGIYLLKEYEKNPYEIKGIGGKIGRHIDEDLEVKISKYAGDFGILQGDFRRIIKNLEKGLKPEQIYNAALKGKKDLGIKIPIRGHASSSKEIFKDVYYEMSSKQKKLDSKFEEMANKEGLYKSYE